jgi:hypothetical protein
VTTNPDPDLHTDPALTPILEELKSREPIFHRPEFGTTQADFENMMAPDFWEVGASGRRYSREFVLAGLQERYSGDYADQWETHEFRCRELAENLYLLTYTLLQRERKTRRATIWQKTATGWKIVFHQGTVVLQP